MAAYRSDSFNLTGSGDAKRLRGEMISAPYFSQLGVQPIMGRDFKPKMIMPARLRSR